MRTGEGAALVAEQLGFQQLIRDRAAVDGMKRQVRTKRAVMDRARQKLLARPRLAKNQRGHIKARDLLRLHTQRLDGRAGRAVDPVKAEPALQCLALPAHRLLGGRAELLHLQRHPLMLALKLEQARAGADRHQQLVRMPGLGQKLIDARVIDRADDIVGIGIARDDHADRLRPALAHLAEQLDPGHPRHALIAQHDLDPLIPENAQRFLARAGAVNVELVLERHLHRFERTGLVIHDEDGGTAGGGAVRAHGGVLFSARRAMPRASPRRRLRPAQASPYGGFRSTVARRPRPRLSAPKGE